MWPGDLAPDDADLGALNGPLSTVDVCTCVLIPIDDDLLSGRGLYVHATRLPAYHCAAAVSSTPSSLSSEVPGFVLRFLRIVSGGINAIVWSRRTLAGSCGQMLAMRS